MRYIGIDVSKDTFMAAFPKENGFSVESFSNNATGIRKFIKKLTPGEDQCVMEATGNYSMLLLYLLDKKKIAASLLNPRQSKNFARTLLEVVKTDKRDACILAEYGKRMTPPVFKMPTEVIIKLKQKRTVLRKLRQQRTAAINVRHSLEVLPIIDKSSVNALNTVVAQLEKQIKRLEGEIVELCSTVFEKQLQRLLTVKGIGITLATSLIITTGCFAGFENARQVSRYLGLSPTYQQSGTSIHYNGCISHCGDSYIRGQLYTAAMSAIQHNKECKAFYERLKANGKNGSVALIAVCNKLIRQAFAVVKNDTDYEDGFVSKPPKGV